MARPVFTDYLQSFPFWMMDIAPIGNLALPIFNPILGFTSVSAPEIQVDEYPIRPGNWFFERKVVHRATISSFVARRGVTFYDSDFWRWTMTGITGGIAYSNIVGASYRRTFMLVHFFARNPLSLGYSALGDLGSDKAQQVTAGAAAAAAQGVGPFEFASRVPAKAYLLKGCTPLKWRSGNDFDATDGSVSIAELDFSCELIEEVSLVGLLPKLL